MRLNNIFFFLALSGFLLFITASCYYDNEEYLYPDNGGGTGCDTTNVTYSGTVTSILATNCNNCHNPMSPSGGVIVNNYGDLITWVNNGKFWGSIHHDPGFSPMPKGGGKLSNCNLLKIKKWINDGALND
jgi:hypothetical protein